MSLGILLFADPVYRRDLQKDGVLVSQISFTRRLVHDVDSLSLTRGRNEWDVQFSTHDGRVYGARYDFESLSEDLPNDVLYGSPYPVTARPGYLTSVRSMESVRKFMEKVVQKNHVV